MNHILQHELVFSLATDAFNKGSLKCFPIVLQYFHFDEGVQHVLLDFYEDSDESSDAVSKQLINKVEAHGLSLSEVSSYCADNARVNYGKHNVVLKIYSNFQMSAKRTSTLKEFCEFVDADECNILRHVVTRWLSLLPVIERVLSKFGKGIFKPWEKIIAPM